ncbi:SWI/SNF complex subunit SWI3A [Phalaenopsis equestris]|uniref:SWI/SNF complex subunit SWI3A n=1 Tax=Phalaenopsis equestris TaxID=78828 RepID=UPI0009E3FBEC|nr:SWI/SNF complex subunit SWI3A [Phalaenopsis equestris]
MTQCVDADLSTRRFRERELHTIPISSSWFKWDEIHEIERRSLPEFFDGGSYSRSPRVYKEYRDFIINKYREDPSRRVTFTEVRKCLVGDVGTLRKVFLFIEKWGLINFSVSNGKQRTEEDGGPVVVVEIGPAAGLKVVPTGPVSSSTSSSLADATQIGGESGFRLPPLTSYSDAFGEWKPANGLICGLCGDRHRSGLNESFNGGIAMCSKCRTNETINGKTDVHLTPPNDHADVKDQSSPVWTDTETLLLLEAVLKHGDDWDLIAQHVRTKNKLDCISRLIHLPFGEHMLGTISAKSSSTNLITPLEEYKSSLQVLNDNPPVLTEANGDRPVETEGAEIAFQGHPLKRRCFPPFTDTPDSFMKQVASLSTVCGPYVAAVAVDAAIRALGQENPSARLVFETNRDKFSIPVSSPFKNEFKSDIKVEDGDAKGNKQAARVPEKSFGARTFQVRAAIATSMAAAAARAKLGADQEEREMELLMASIIQAQLKKLQYKMKYLMEAEAIMEKELSYVQQMKSLIVEEWMNLLQKLFHSGTLRWGDQGFPKPLIHSFSTRGSNF